MSESYLLKTQKAATGEKIYYLASAKHLLIDHKAGTADDNWFTDKFGNINSTATPVIGVYAAYSNLPSASGLATGSYALVTEGHVMHRVLETDGGKAWTASNKGVPVDGTRLFVNMSDGNKLYRWTGTVFAPAVCNVAKPVIYANRIRTGAVTPTAGVEPGKTRTVLWQPDTDDPILYRSVQNGNTWEWDSGVSIERFYGTYWQDALFIETDTGKYWTVSTSDTHLAPVNDTAQTKLLTFTKWYGSSGWVYGLTSDQDNPPGSGRRALVFTGSGIVWCHSAYNQLTSEWYWDTDNTVSAEEDINLSTLYFTTVDGKLWMYMAGTGLVLIATTGTGTSSGGSSDITFEVFGSTTYPNPSAWT